MYCLSLSTIRADHVNHKRKTASLVLGSGGARGLAHIGVIRELEARDYEIRAIAGCSIGALIGGIYAIGELETYAKWVSGLNQSDIFRLLDWSFSGGGLIRGDRLINKLKGLVGDRNIEDLPLDYTAVAVDIEREKEIWMSEGSLFDAIRASIAIPGLVTPHPYQDRRLVDGGLLNPVPVAPTLRTLTDLTIVVDVNGKEVKPHPLKRADEGDETGGSFLQHVRELVGLTDSKTMSNENRMAMSEVMMRSLDIMQGVITRQHLAVFRPDLVISIPKNTCMIHEFHLAEPVISLGRKLAGETLDGWQI